MAHNKLRRRIMSMLDHGEELHVDDVRTILRDSLDALGGEVRDTRSPDAECAISLAARMCCTARSDGWLCTQQCGHTSPHRARSEPQGEVYAEWPRTFAAPPTEDEWRDLGRPDDPAHEGGVS